VTSDAQAPARHLRRQEAVRRRTSSSCHLVFIRIRFAPGFRRAEKSSTYQSQRFCLTVSLYASSREPNRSSPTRTLYGGPIRSGYFVSIVFSGVQLLHSRDQCACAFTEPPFMAIAASSSSLIVLGSILAHVCEIGWVGFPKPRSSKAFAAATRAAGGAFSSCMSWQAW